MMTLVAFATFAGALAASAYALTSTLSGRLDRMISALRGQHHNWEIVRDHL